MVDIHNSRAYCPSVTAKQQQCQSRAPVKEDGLGRVSFKSAGMLLCSEQAWKGQKDHVRLVLKHMEKTTDGGLTFVKAQLLCLRALWIR